MTTWAPATVMARFLEAAATERFFSIDGPAVDRGYWPVFNPLVVDDLDRDGKVVTPEAVWKTYFDDNARDDYLKKWQGKGCADPGAISRHDEVLLWTCRIIKDEKVRRIVWTWAFCAATPKRSFAKACEHYGWVRQTAYKRLCRAFEQISSHLANERTLLRYPADKWMRQLPASMADTDGKLADVTGEHPQKIHRPYRAEKSSNLPELRDMSWAEKQMQREAKRRAKSEAGVPVKESEAA